MRKSIILSFLCVGLLILIIGVFITVGNSDKYDSKSSNSKTDNPYLSEEEKEDVKGELVTCYYKEGKIKEFELDDEDEYYSRDEKEELEESSPIVATFKESYIYELDTDGSGVTAVWRTREIKYDDKLISENKFKDQVTKYKKECLRLEGYDSYAECKVTYDDKTLLLKARASDSEVKSEVEFEDATKERIIYLVTKNNEDAHCE